MGHMMPKRSGKTIIELGEYLGNPTLTIYPLDENGMKIQKSLLGFGKKKAQAIVEHFEEIKKFAEENEDYKKL